MSEQSKTPLLEIKDCTMKFPGVVALSDVSFSLLPGECHALVGENGAGKSTLAKCITGEYRMTEGQLFIGGEEVDVSSYTVSKSQHQGLAIVHQEFQLMEDLTSLENIFIGHYERKGPFIDWKAQKEKAEELMEFLQCSINLTIPVKFLRTAEKQIVQLAKAIILDAQVVILDELTAVLQEKDIENIFRIIKILKKKGIGLIYVSHRLDEVFEICDSYTVLCDGKHIKSGRVSDIDKPKLIEMIIGRELSSDLYPSTDGPIGDTILEVKNLTSNDTFKNINLHVKAGEIVGIAGLVGAGKTELINAIFGNFPVTGGDIFIKGEKAEIRNPMDAINYKIGLVPDERKLLGLNMMFDVRNNTTMPSWKKFKKYNIFSDHKAEMEKAFEYNEKLRLKYHSLHQKVLNLSGGNQQKVVIAKWMLADSEIFLFDEPTRGIDVGAKFEIYKQIKELTNAGKAVIIVSPELEELIGLAHRIYIMFEGEMKDEVSGERKTQEVIINSLLGVN